MFSSCFKKRWNQNDNDYDIPKNATSPDLFFNDRLEKYLGGPLASYTLPKKSTDEVKLEETKCPLLPPLYPYKPKLFFLPEENITVHRIVGYREIYAKRLRIEYLKGIEGQETIERGGDICFCQSGIHDHLNWIEAAPGGGDGKKLPAAPGKKAPAKKLVGKKIGEKKTTGKKMAKAGGKVAGGKVAGKKKAGGKVVGGKVAGGKVTGKKVIQGKKTGMDLIRHKAEQYTKEKIEKDLEYFRKNEHKLHQVAAAVHTHLHSIIPTHLIQPNIKKPAHKKTAEYRSKRERGEEWLSLSPSEDEGVIDSLTKPHMAWMKKRLAHESQLLQKHLGCFNISSKIFGRAIYFVKPNSVTRQIEFLVSKKKQVYFAVTSLLIWIPLCLMVQAVLDIKFGQVDQGKYTVLEKVMVEKYTICLQAVMVHLALVGLWSIVVILQDALVISHYLNCWNLALNEMETSAVSKIQRYTFYNWLIFVVYTIIIVAGFYQDWPESIRGTSLVIAMLICRGVVTELAADDTYRLYYQIFGLFFYLYCVFSTRMLFTLIQIVALVIKNSAEMWNLKFGLMFAQFLIKNRGDMVHVEFNHSLVKTFTHHRLICGLVNMFGEAFAWPIITYMMFQMTVFTTSIVAATRLIIREKQDLSKAILTIQLTESLKDKFTIAKFMPETDDTITILFVIAQIYLDFMFTTEAVAAAGQSFIDGFEFVRRQGAILCKTSHQRRMIQSLEWSMSAAAANNLSIRGYFTVDRAMIFSAIAASLGFYSLIIQLQDLVINKAIILSKNCSAGTAKPDGYCVYELHLDADH